MDNLSWGNPVAHRVRVHFNTASKKIYEGMPVCYNFDTTTNWAGGSVSDGAVTASTTLTAGSPATAAAKYLEVEEPSADNIQWFAGVVARGGWVGKTTSATAGVGQLLDIYVPNGAIVPVRTDSNCLIGQTILAITTGSQELGVPLETDSRPVAITEETYNRGTAGLVLAKLDPNLFLYQDHAGTALSVDDADTTTATLVNSIQLDFLGSSAYQKGLYCKGTLSGGGGCAYGMFKFRTQVDSALTANAHTICANLHLGDDAELTDTPEYSSAPIYATVESSGTGTADLSAGDLSCLYLGYYVKSGTKANSFYWININGGLAASGYDAADGLIWALHNEYVGLVAHTTDSFSHSIPILVGGVTYYIMLTDGTP